LQSDGGHPWRSRFGGVLAPIFWLFASLVPAAAQGVSPQASYADPSFQTVLNNPANLAHEVKYASEAKDDSDLENAIGAYDRLLFYNPALSRVRFELGVLYARLGSYQQARAYFASALQMRDITPEMAERLSGTFPFSTGSCRLTNSPVSPRPDFAIRPTRRLVRDRRRSWRRAVPSIMRSRPARTGIGSDRSR
jgi:hypothetical protein